MIEWLGYDINPMSGVKGEFYTLNRIKDLKSLVREILRERWLGSDYKGPLTPAQLNDIATPWEDL